MAEDLADLRRRLAGTLPGRIAAAVEGYEAFALSPPPDDPKGFAAWHAAAKAALAHVDYLVKLARWAVGKEETAGDDGVDALIDRARAALAGFADEDEGEA